MLQATALRNRPSHSARPLWTSQESQAATTYIACLPARPLTIIKYDVIKSAVYGMIYLFIYLMCTGVRWHPGVRVGRIACSTACPPRVHDGESAAAAELSGLPDSWRRCSPAPTRVTGLSAHRPVSTGTLDASASLLQSNCHRPNGCMYVSLKSQVSGVAAAAPVSCSVGRILLVVGNHLSNHPEKRHEDGRTWGATMLLVVYC